jgi:formylglycine-generating enzyme required for sulfatase activity
MNDGQTSGVRALHEAYDNSGAIGAKPTGSDMGNSFVSPATPHQREHPLVFISYSHEDKDKAIVMQDKLTAMGLPCWRDERCIRFGDDWAEEITRAIHQCDVFILLLSRASNSADYVAKEIAIAHYFRKAIVPVLLDDTEISYRLLPYVVREHFCDLEKHSLDDLVVQLKDKLSGSGERTEAAAVAMPGADPHKDGTAGSPLDSVRFVTKSMYLAFVRASGSRKPLGWNDTEPYFASHECDMAVTGVSWSDATSYCDWAGERLPATTSHSRSYPPAFVADGRQVSEWRDGGNERHKHVCDPRSSMVIAVMDREYRATNVGFRCIPATATPKRQWVSIQPGRCAIGTDIPAFQRIADEYRLPSWLARPVLNRKIEQFDLNEYQVSRTCVSNEEYFAFTRATGASWPSHWDAQWLSRRKHPFPARIASLPVVNVSAEQARAYCIWSHTRLPAWTEWERAAGGPTGQSYPWASAYSAERCNSAESERGALARVDDYPQGDSPEGARQLCGNVWEWILGPQGVWELRGGSYRAPCEIWGLPYAFKLVEPCFLAPDVGFRLCRH